MEKPEFDRKLDKAIESLKDSRNTLNGIKRGIRRDLDLYPPDYPEITSSLSSVKSAIEQLEILQARDLKKLEEVM